MVLRPAGITVISQKRQLVCINDDGTAFLYSGSRLIEALEGLSVHNEGILSQTLAVFNGNVALSDQVFPPSSVAAAMM